MLMIKKIKDIISTDSVAVKFFLFVLIQERQNAMHAFITILTFPGIWKHKFWRKGYFRMTKNISTCNAKVCFYWCWQISKYTCNVNAWFLVFIEMHRSDVMKRNHGIFVSHDLFFFLKKNHVSFILPNWDSSKSQGCAQMTISAFSDESCSSPSMTIRRLIDRNQSPLRTLEIARKCFVY